MKFEPAQFTTKLILPAEELDRVTSHLDNLSKSLPIDITFQSQDVTLKELTVTTSISTHKAVVELLKAMDLPEEDIKKLARVKSYVEIALQNLTHRILSNIR